MNNIILDSQYFPSVAYISLIAKAKVVAINDVELFNKQSYRNRCSILSSNGKLDLTVPVDHKSNRKMNGLQISYIDRWAAIHTKSIQSAYNKSPFFEYYDKELFAPLLAEYQTLLDLNTAILTTILDVLEIDTQLIFLSELKETEKAKFTDYTEHIHPKRPKIKVSHKDYHQVFSEKMFYNLSILDAIFCLGQETILLLEAAKQQA